MDDELLVRVYNVGLGDCIYLRVPDAGALRHILIDCGTIGGGSAVLEAALTDLKKRLPTGPSGRKRLDLLVVTHPHQDHIAGFRLDWFTKVDIRQIWLSAAMDLDHEQARTAHQMHAFAAGVLRDWQAMPLAPALASLAAELLALSNDAALDALRTTLPQKNHLPNDKPLYVHADTEVAQLGIFAEETTRCRILNPAANVDGEYLGIAGTAFHGFNGFAGEFGAGASAGLAQNWSDPAHQPANISAEDFGQLRARLANNALAFVLADSELANNTSTVLLLEWRGQRLLFTGDLQCKTERQGAYEQGKKNGGWNVMWHHHRAALDAPAAFLKIGHHGSENATPWTGEIVAEPGDGAPQGVQHPVNQILDALMPPGSHNTQLVVSTERNTYPTIPDRALMITLGQRVAEPRVYAEPEHYRDRMSGGQWAKYLDKSALLVPAGTAQPCRTDLEHQVTSGKRVPFVDLVIRPAAGWQPPP